MTTIGFVGLGAMGSRIAGRLLDAGNHVYGTNRTADKAQPLLERGLIWLDTPREVAAAAGVVFSMVTDDAALDTIAVDPDGIVAGLEPRAVYVDMSTVSPRASRALSERVRTLGAEMLDAPVSGSIPQAETGTLAIMVGGNDSRLAAEVMGSSSIGSPMLRARIPLLLDLPEHAWFDVELMQKDVHLVREAAAELAIPLPSATVADEMLTRARELGYAHRDLAALHEVLAHTPARDDRLSKAAPQ